MISRTPYYMMDFIMICHNKRMEIKASDMSFFDGKKQVFKDPDDIASGGWQLMYCITIIVNIINMLDKSILSKEIDLAAKVVDRLEDIRVHLI